MANFTPEVRPIHDPCRLGKRALVLLFDPLRSISQDHCGACRIRVEFARRCFDLNPNVWGRTKGCHVLPGAQPMTLAWWFSRPASLAPRKVVSKTGMGRSSIWEQTTATLPSMPPRCSRLHTQPPSRPTSMGCLLVQNHAT